MLTTPIPGVAGDQVHKSSAPLLGMASCPSPIHGVSILDEVTHQPESRTRENRLSGSEGGRAEHNRFSLPLSVPWKYYFHERAQRILAHVSAEVPCRLRAPPPPDLVLA